MMIATSSYATPTLATEAAKRSEPRFDSAAGTSTAGAQVEAGQVPIVVFNPRSRFDSEAGVFVMEFRSARTGEIERRFPDEQQLKAYRQAAANKSNNQQNAGIGAAVVV